MLQDFRSFCKAALHRSILLLEVGSQLAAHTALPVVLLLLEPLERIALFMRER